MLKLQIDTNALNTLFPEGSQARLDLQAAVIDEFARRLIKKDLAKLEAKEFEAEISKHIQYSWANRRNELSASTKSGVEKQINDILVQANKEHLDKMIGRGSEAYELYISQLETSRKQILDSNIKEYIDLKVTQAMKNVSFKLA